MTLIHKIEVEINALAKNNQVVLSGRNRKPGLALAAKADDELVIHHTTDVATRVKAKGRTNDLTEIVKLSKGFKSPKLQDVTKHTSILDDLYEKAEHLEAIEAFLTQSFAQSRGQQAALDAVAKLRQQVVDLLSTAFTNLQQIAEASLPIEVRKFSDMLVSILIEAIPAESYSEITHAFYVFRKDEDWHYTCYVTIDDLENSSGYVFNDYNFVLSALISADYFVTFKLTSLPHFQLPGSFNEGKTISSIAELKKTVDVLLAANDLVHDLNKRSLRISARGKDTITSLPGVKEVDITNDVLSITLGRGAKVDTILQVVLPLLNDLLGQKRRKSSVTWRGIPKDRPTKLEFMLVSNKGGGVNKDKLKELKTALDLDDDDVEALTAALIK
jgi:hypothetical protein